MDAINALDSSTPKPRKKRENKPRTKSPAKTDVQPPQGDKTSNEKSSVLGGGVAQTPAKNGGAKKNRSRKVAASSSSDAMNSNTDTIEVTPSPSPSIPSPPKEPLQEENVNVAAHREEKIDPKSDKKKKKKKKKNEDAVADNLGKFFEQEINSKEELKKEIAASNSKLGHDYGNKKDTKGDVDDGRELKGNVEITVSLLQQKKSKKKKKNKSEEISEHKAESEVNSEKTAEEEETVQSKKAKKKRKKEKNDADSPEKIVRVEEMQMGEPETEEKTEQISNGKKKKKRKHREGDSELVDENRKMFEEQKDGENVTNPSADKEENHERTPKLNHKSKKGSSMKNDSVVLTPPRPGQDTVGLLSEKKKRE